ncbi:DHH family phosphoesterase [Capnocytophaga catalasegens]|uniref:Exopolyphosphatase n=1 Tax=Capnocytophaga catalasegens TaxID=1004260 RepID=A0AAV5AXR2_9FLAO|nr:bifunctional oligoribonuclease/PAP phosphatase NrnA [Capnocytophaga catalasegens]GIZ14812.1 exopolyphosphatase [Capnocytophaga catalasegens]GJM51180.1 exopolyphosphatase [Capnocytophaga catalasegens]GJM53509.1 exopolyphosphatase [Capnocytophaga catalasegens]
MNLQDIKILTELLVKRPKISIIPHKNPDGDAIGSCLALYQYLRKKQHDVCVVSPTDYPDFLKWLPDNDSVLVFTNNSQEALNQIANSELIFTLDFNSLYRADTLTEALQASKADFVMIDHHQQPDTYAAVTYSDSTASSTCELIYKFIEKLGDVELIDQDIATCLYTGIMTDTGSFKYSLTTATTHRIVASLIEKGANPSLISTNVFDSYSIDRLQLLGKALDNLVFIEQYQTAYITLSANDLKQFNFQKGDTEGVVNYGLRIKQADLAVIFIEEENEKIIKISFRSKGNLDVNVLARKYFSGGGHINASGGRSEESLEDTLAYFLKILPEFLSLPEAYNSTI